MFGHKGQSIAEYAILIALVIAAAVAMQTYVKRGLQGRVKYAVDYVGEGGSVGSVPFAFDAGGQYEPEYIDSKQVQASDKTSNSEDFQSKGYINRPDIKESSTVEQNSYEILKAPGT